MSTGALSKRPTRQSNLLFGWRSNGPGIDSLSGLDAYTGQPGTLLNVGAPTVGGAVFGQNGVSVVAGHAMPRFDQVVGQGSVTRLKLESVAAQDSERVQWAWPLKIMPISLFIRVWPGWAAGSNNVINSYAIQLGDSTLGGGSLYVGRVGTTWQASRTRPVTGTISASFVESGATVYPMDVLVTLSGAGQLALWTRDSAAIPVLSNGTTTPTNAAMCTLTEVWGASLLYAPTGDAGGKWWYEAIKIARGVQTLATMDLLR